MCFLSSNALVSTISKVLVHSTSNVANNLRILMSKVKLNTFHVKNHVNELYNTVRSKCAIEMCDEVNIINELICIRDGNLHCDISHEDVNLFL